MSQGRGWGKHSSPREENVQRPWDGEEDWKKSRMAERLEKHHQGLCFMILCPFKWRAERPWVFSLHFGGDPQGCEDLEESLFFLWDLPLDSLVRGQTSLGCLFWDFLTAQMEMWLLPLLAPKEPWKCLSQHRLGCILRDSLLDCLFFF